MIGPEYMESLALAVKEMPLLRSLNLTGNKMDRAALTAIFGALYGTHLNTLILDKNKGIGKTFVKSMSWITKKRKGTASDRYIGVQAHLIPLYDLHLFICEFS